MVAEEKDGDIDSLRERGNERRGEKKQRNGVITHVSRLYLFAVRPVTQPRIVLGVLVQHANLCPLAL